MIQVPVGQSQLSGWGHYAEPTVLFINKVPNPFMAGQTIDLSATKSAGGTELHFSDGTVLKYEESGNLVPALTGVRVWSVPAEGTTIPNGLDYVTIYASYITKHGKTLNAIPAKVPVARPSFMRVIVPEEPLIDEGWYLQTLPRWEDKVFNGIPCRGIKSACHIEGVSFVVYWVDSNGNIVRTTEAVETPNISICYSIPFTQSSTQGRPDLMMGERTQSATFTRYRSILDEGEEITLENAVRFQFRYTINGITLNADTYMQMNPIVSWGPFNLPTTYSGTTSATITITKNSKVRYKNGKVLIGRYADDGLFWLAASFRYKVVGGWWEYVQSQTITLADGRQGSLYQYCIETRRDGNIVVKVAGRDYSCSGGRVTWTNT